MSAIGNVPLPPCTVTTSSAAVNPRRSASDGHGDRSSHSPMQKPKRAGCPNTDFVVSPARLPADVAQAERDRAADRHRAPTRGTAHAARAVVDAEVVAARAVDDEHREHARGRGREPERVPLRLGQRFERGEHVRERGGLDSGHRRVDRDELDRRHAVDGRQHAHDVIGGIRRRREQRFDRVVGCRELRDTVAPVLLERELVLRARVGRDLDALARERHAVTPNSSRTCG